MKNIISLCTLLSICCVAYGADQSRRQQMAQQSNANLAAIGALQVAHSTGQKVAGAPFAHQHASPQLQQQISNHNANSGKRK